MNGAADEASVLEQLEPMQSPIEVTFVQIQSRSCIGQVLLTQLAAQTGYPLGTAAVTRRSKSKKTIANKGVIVLCLNILDIWSDRNSIMKMCQGSCESRMSERGSATNRNNIPAREDVIYGAEVAGVPVKVNFGFRNTFRPSSEFRSDIIFPN